MTEIRTSNVVYVVARLRLAGRECFPYAWAGDVSGELPAVLRRG